MNPELFVRTPLVRSLGLEAWLGRPVWLKLEALQPSGSFKQRGVGLHCSRLKAAGAQRLVSSSGGNAGLATADVGQRLALPVTVHVPDTTPEFARRRLELFGADVIAGGADWAAAHARAEEDVATSGGALVHPFDHPDLWEGHASMIDEVLAEGVIPGTILVSVGGGGLLLGVLEGLARSNVRSEVVAIETEGADSLACSLLKGEAVTLEAIRSVATSLGARRVADEAFERARARGVHPLTVTDGQAVRAAKSFLDEHHLLVEPACGAALAPLYEGLDLPGDGPVLVIVCGGSVIEIDRLLHLAHELP